MGSLCQHGTDIYSYLILQVMMKLTRLWKQTETLFDGANINDRSLTHYISKPEEISEEQADYRGTKNGER